MTTTPLFIAFSSQSCMHAMKGLVSDILTASLVGEFLHVNNVMTAKIVSSKYLEMVR